MTEARRLGSAILAFLDRHRAFVVPLALLALVAAVYLPYALKSGWYYDDWRLAAYFKGVGSSWSSQFNECTATIPAGRDVSCLYLVSEWHFFTDHLHAYAALSMVFLFAMSWLTYLILVRCRLGWGWAALIAALLVAFPASDSTRLWAAASYGQYVVVLELAGVLLALHALRLRSGRLRWVWHAVSLLMMLLAMVTYEIAIPLVAFNGFIYYAAYRDRPAIRRGLADLGLAIAFTFYRLVLDPPGSTEGFVEHRTISGNVSRAGHLIEAAWNTWHQTFVPGALATVAIIALLAFAGVVATRDAKARRSLLPWALLLGAALVVGLAGTLVYQTANAFYTPSVGSLFNRLVLPASIAYVCIFVALLGILFELLQRFTPWAWVAVVVVALIALVSGWHQLRISTSHKQHYEDSWLEQQKGLEGYEVAVQGLPDHSRIIGFGVPTWEPEFIPVFSAPWDLKGALQYRTGLGVRKASPMMATDPEPCEAAGVVPEGTQTFRYKVPGEPLYFIDAPSRTAVRIESAAECRAAVEKFGVPPFFAG